MIPIIIMISSICVTVVVLNVHFRTPQTHTMAPWVRRCFKSKGWMFLKKPTSNCRVFIHILPRLLAMKRPQYEKDRHRSVRAERVKSFWDPTASMPPLTSSARVDWIYLFTAQEISIFPSLAEMFSVLFVTLPPPKSKKDRCSLSLYFSLSLFKLAFFPLARCDLLKSPYFSFTTEDNFYAPEENEMTELEFSLKQSSKRKR